MGGCSSAEAEQTKQKQLSQDIDRISRENATPVYAAPAAPPPPPDPPTSFRPPQPSQTPPPPPAAPAANSYTDAHVTLTPYFSVPEGRMDEFMATFHQFYAKTKGGTGAAGQCLYYNFAIEGNTVFCREGYRNARAAMAHLQEVDAELKHALEIVGPDGLSLAAMGPAAELAQLRGKLTPLGAKFFELQRSGFVKPTGLGCVEDSHVTILPYFTVPEDRMGEFIGCLDSFLAHTRAGTFARNECLYYGFAIEGNTVFCREGYRNARAAMAHLQEVDAELKHALKIVGDGGLSLAVVGPAAELDQMRTQLPAAEFGTKFLVSHEAKDEFARGFMMFR